MATNYVTADYTEVIDLQTVADKTSIIGIHTPVGNSPYTKLSGFFDQFRKYRYNGIKSLIMVPSAGLPIDPLGVTRITGTTGTMDPRDTFNPIITHGAHGESLTSTLDRIYTSRGFVNADGSPGKDATSSGIIDGQSPSADEFRVSNIIDTVYYQKLTDTSWKKWGIQSGVKMRNLYPLVHKLALNRPILPVGTTGSSSIFNTNRGEFEPPTSGSSNMATSPDDATSMGALNGNVWSLPISMIPAAGSDHSYLQEFTNGMTRLGWLPTATSTQSSGNMEIAMLPKLMMMCMVLPPAYSCEQFFRLVIKHSFSFADFTSSLGLKTRDHISTTNRSYYNWIDYESVSSGSKEELPLEVSEGTTIDVINGSTDLVSDGVS